jgi:hypothetical protein
MSNFKNNRNLKLAAGFTIGAEAVETINVGIQLKDRENGNELTERAALYAWLSDDAEGDDICAAAPDGGWAIGTDGVLISKPPTVANSIVVDGNLAIDAVPEKFKTSQVLAYFLNGVLRTKAATTALVFTAAHTITAAKFGCILIQIDAAGNISTKVVASPQAYDNAPAALAALPAADAGKIAIGHIAIENNAGDWVANTDDLTNGSDLTTAAFVDATESVPSTTPKAGELVSEIDGDIDVAITHAAGAKTLYLNLLMPDGKIYSSPAITFA